MRRGSYLRTYAYRFIELCSPALPEKVVRAAVMADAGNGKPDAKPEAVTRRAAPQLWRSSGNTLSRVEVKRTA